MPSKKKIFLGPQIRRIRGENGLTQAELATAIGVSPSYVNLMERNQRPVSAEILVRLSSVYNIEPAQFGGERTDQIFSSLASAFVDPIFAGAGVTREDAFELAAGNPVLAEAVAALFRAWRSAEEELLESRTAGRRGADDPVEEARSFLHANKNYFPEIDAAGEAIAKESLGHSLFDTLSERMLAKHGLNVRILPHQVMAGAWRRLNRHSREIAISEALDAASRSFNLALQLALIEQGALLDRVVNTAKFETDSGRRLARAALANYSAGAMMLPYSPFIKAAKALHYDIEALARRFGASFEQVAHRLTTLRRPDAEGIPFFFLRIDAAGNVSKRFSGDIFPFARYGGSCPLWKIHDALRGPRRIVTQLIELPDQSRFFSIARSVTSGAGGYHVPHVERVVVLGCAAKDASALIYGRDVNLDPEAPAAPIGVSCRLCERPDCAARAHPPMRRRLITDEHLRMSTPFAFAFD